MNSPAQTESRESGIERVDRLAWGTHFCHLYETKEDLLEVMVPYFSAGLKNKEFCLWVVSGHLTKEDARSALEQVAHGGKLQNVPTRGQGGYLSIQSTRGR